MAAGGPGDHPLTDILRFKLSVYNKRCDNLVRELSKYLSTDQLYDCFKWVDNLSASESDIKNLEQQLEKKLISLEKASNNK